MAMTKRQWRRARGKIIEMYLNEVPKNKWRKFKNLKFNSYMMQDLANFLLYNFKKFDVFDTLHPNNWF